MRVLVIGASGYVGSRVIPELLDAGHTVLAGARDPDKLEAFWWSSRVQPVALDVSDDDSVRAALGGEAPPDAVIYLVHGMAGDDFREVDLAAARRVRAAVDASPVGVLVYVSGIIPDIPREDLSEHLVSRLEVEEELGGVAARFVSLRAAIILGAGSTSFELMSQLAQRLPVTVLPDWMQHRVEPVAVIDVARAVRGAIENHDASGTYDVGGGEPISYPDLIEQVLETSGRSHPTISLPVLPQAFVGTVAGMIADVPSQTVKALIESLREDMVAGDDRWTRELLPADAGGPLPISESLSRSFSAPEESVPAGRRDPMGLLPGDPDWAVGSTDKE